MADLPIPIVLFDGNCALCNRSVQFVLRHEREPRYNFAPLQSTVAKKLLQSHGIAVDSATEAADWETIYVVENGQVLTHSTAVLQIAKTLKRPWRWLSYWRWIPRPLRDTVYRQIGRWRYWLFGNSNYCAAFEQHSTQAHRFLETDQP